ncbi:MAG: hypothetical protein ACNA7K_03425 [Acholeplasmataceae bacterium]
MKFLFKIIVLPIITLLFFPVLFFALTYKAVEIPYDEFEPSAQVVSLTDMVYEQLDVFLEDNTSESVITLGIPQASANQMLGAQFREMNAFYALDTAPTSDDKDYVIKEPMFGYQGSWMRFEDDVVEIESGLHVFVPNVDFVYKTRILIAFKLDVSTEEVVLVLDKLTLGNLPLAWLFGPVSWAVEQITGTSLSDLINAQLGDVATFDVAKREIRLSVDDLLTQQAENDPESAALLDMLTRFISENDLLDIGFEDEQFAANLALGKARDDQAPFTLPANLIINNEAELQSILAAKASTLLFSTLTLEAGENPFIELDALTLNRVFDYFLADQIVAPGIIQQIDLFEKYTLSAYVPYVTMDGDFIVNIPLTLRSIENPTHVFATIIKIQATPEMSGPDLRIVLEELAMGEISLGAEDIDLVLTLLGDTGFIEDGALVIKDFDAQMQQAGMSIIDAAMVNNKLRLTVELSSELPLEDIQGLIGDVLDTISSNPDLPPELAESIDDVLDSLLSGDPDAIDQAVENLLSELEGLDDQAAEDLLNDLIDALGEEGSDFDDLFNQVS